MSEQIESQILYYQFCKGQTGLTVGIRDVLWSHHSQFQHIQVWETDILGRMLTLNGVIMFTEYDEFVYHEMIAHPALCLLGDARRVLVIGGGDGGTVREVLRHPVQHVDMVEIDPAMIEAARQYFPNHCRAFEDPRFHLVTGDGVAYAQQAAAGQYDLTLVDGTDPIGFGQRLYEADFYRACERLLSERGILVVLSESPFDPTYRHIVGQVHRDLRTCFPIVETYLCYVPTYQMGMWSFTLASKQRHPVRDFVAGQAEQLLKLFAAELRYYNVDVHLGAFALPTFVRRLIEDI